jgi:LacI family transcriptional regulator
MRKRAIAPTTRRRTPRSVIVSFPSRISQSDELLLLRGIFAYARANTRWEFVTGAPIFDFPVEQLRELKADGIITAIGTVDDAAIAASLRTPLVNLSGWLRALGPPRVTIDNAAAGRLAAEHLFFRGYRNFAFYGAAAADFSQSRQDAFCAWLAEHGYSASRRIFSLTFKQWIWADPLEQLAQWIATLPTPLGLFAVSDRGARMVVRACGIVGRRVPQDVGVIGLDNDEAICAFGSPTLSSIARDWYATGFEAATLLDEMMAQSRLTAPDRLIPPRGIVARESTDAFVSGDPDVARAIAFAQQNLSRPIGVKQWVDAIGGSRRRLEMAFRQSLNCSPMVFLARLRTDKAKGLLARDDLSYGQIASQCGFSDLRQFRRAFLSVARMTPRQYREVAKRDERDRRR